MNEYGQYCRPSVVSLLKAISLDASYERGEGDCLWQRHGDELVPVLDLVGGYGANLFGHNHPELVAEAQRLLDEKVPMLTQGSVRTGAGRLARALCEHVGDCVVIFTNSGTETVEAAIKHAYLARGKPIFWAVQRAFHGKTLGAIQFTWSYHEPFSAFGPRVRYINPDDPSDWDHAALEVDQVSAAIVEPIQGEGGVIPLSRDFLNWLARTCRENHVPIVADEIQTGMGRTGSFLASTELGFTPDYVCLSKALGGGLAKIGALLIRRDLFVDRFAMIHTSTFCEDEASCLIALKALEILSRDCIADRCSALGKRLVGDLLALQVEFPDVIKDVRGRGLLIGLELRNLSDSASNVLSMLSQQMDFGYAASAYFLNVHGIRIAPTLSSPFTLRIQPSAYLADEAISYFLQAARQFCEALMKLDVAHLTGFQVGRAPTALIDYRGRYRLRRERARSNHRVAFLGNFLLPQHAGLFDPALAAFEAEELEEYLSRISHFVEPAIYDQVIVESQLGDQVQLSFIGLSVTARQIMAAMRERRTAWIVEKISKSVALAQSAGCQVIGLGGHTSIVTGNGLRLRSNGIAVTSGNSLTVGMGLRALQQAAKIQGIKLDESRCAVVGANGNIASMHALMLAPQVRELVLIVRNTQSARFVSLVRQIEKRAPHTAIRQTENLDELKSCSLIVSASNAAEPLIYPEHLSEKPIVICDIAAPSDVHSSVTTDRPAARVIRGAEVKVPRDEGFTIGGIPTKKGHVFPCMAETLIMGLESMREGSCGRLDAERVDAMLRLADKHGFTLEEQEPKATYVS